MLLEPRKREMKEPTQKGEDTCTNHSRTDQRRILGHGEVTGACTEVSQLQINEY